MIYVIGFLAQVFFSARILLQWFLSERAKKVISPAIFWQLSIVGAYLLFVDGGGMPLPLFWPTSYLIIFIFGIWTKSTNGKNCRLSSGRYCF